MPENPSLRALIARETILTLPGVYDGIRTGWAAAMLPFAEMNTLMGCPAVHAFERRFGMQPAQPA